MQLGRQTYFGAVDIWARTKSRVIVTEVLRYWLSITPDEVCSRNCKVRCAYLEYKPGVGSVSVEQTQMYWLASLADEPIRSARLILPWITWWLSTFQTWQSSELLTRSSFWWHIFNPRPLSHREQVTSLLLNYLISMVKGKTRFILLCAQQRPLHTRAALLHTQGWISAISHRFHSEIFFLITATSWHSHDDAPRDSTIFRSLFIVWIITFTRHILVIFTANFFI